jgi:DNA-binding Lrp family transcriptional regulator
LESSQKRARARLRSSTQGEAVLTVGGHRITQIRAVYAISGLFDYMALIEAESTAEIDSVLDAIGAIAGVEDTQSSVVLSVKFDRH